MGTEDPGFESNDNEPSNKIIYQINSHQHEETDDEDETLDVNDNFLGRAILNVRTFFAQIVLRQKSKLKIFFYLALVCLYFAYLITAIAYNARHSIPIDYCDGLGLLIILTSLGMWGVFYYKVLKGYFGNKIKAGFVPLKKVLGPIFKNSAVQIFIVVGILAGVVGFVVWDAWDQKGRLRSALGIPILILFGLVVSKFPGHVRWRTVVCGVLFQFLFGLAILRWEGGKIAFNCMSEKVKTFLDFTDVGSEFVYGYLVNGLIIDGKVVGRSIFVFKALTVIYFFSFFISMLFHLGVMQFVCIKLGWLLQISLGTTAAESINAAANIFVGQTVAPLLIKPYMQDMTKSELHAIMTSGFATAAGSALAAFITFGVDPGYLFSASVMAAPASLAMSKLYYPETKKSRTTSQALKSFKLEKTGSNALDAASQGATQAGILIGNIVASLIAFMAIVAFLNAIVGWLGSLVGLEDFTFEFIISKIFIPFAWVIGIDNEEIEKVGLLLGLKTVANEFVAIEKLIDFRNSNDLSPRSIAVSTYALCSFASLASIGMQLGGIGALAPERRAHLAQSIVRALVAGTMTGLLNACIAGTLLSEIGYKEWMEFRKRNNTDTLYK